LNFVMVKCGVFFAVQAKYVIRCVSASRV
jgi:hypothetical protein